MPIVRKKIRNRKLSGKLRRGTTIIKKVEVLPRSKYMGSSLTVFNRREFLESKKEQYILRQLNGYEARKTEIMTQEGSEEEKQQELDVLDSKQLSPEQLEKKALEFAKYEVNREQKHYKAYLKGNAFYKYQGMNHPVLTEEFLMKSKGLTEIHKTEESNESISNEANGRGIVESANPDPVHTSDEGRVSEAV